MCYHERNEQTTQKYWYVTTRSVAAVCEGFFKDPYGPKLGIVVEYKGANMVWLTFKQLELGTLLTSQFQPRCVAKDCLGKDSS